MSRHKGTGMLYKQPGCATFMLKYYRDGKCIREATGLTSYNAARQKLNQRLAQVANNTFSGLRIERIRVDELFQDLCNDRESRKKSAYDHRKRWLHLGSVFGSRFANGVTSTDITAYLAQRTREGASLATCNRELACLRRMFRLGQQATPPKLVSAPRISTPNEDNARQGFLAPALYDRFAAEAKEPWLRALFEIAYRFGWRKGELLMRVRQADFEANVLRLDRSKNGEGREVTMTPTIRTLLAECARGKKPDDSLFTRANGKPVKDFRVAWRRLTAEAGVPDLKLHDLRRTAVRNMVRAGITEKVAMTITGHKTRNVFERYNITDQRDIRQAVERLEPSQNKTGSESEFGHDYGHDSPAADSGSKPGRVN